MGNILIVGRTSCGKTHFTQKLVLNRFFGILKIVGWVSYIYLSRERKAEIDSCFSCKVEFHYPKSIEQFDDLLEIFKASSKTPKRKNDSVDSDNTSSFEESDGGGFAEKATRDRRIVMDDVSGLADESKKFASFLTVARKFNYTCVYIFHIIYPENTIWRTILPQTSIFNIFLASVSLSHARRI